MIAVILGIGLLISGLAKTIFSGGSSLLSILFEKASSHWVAITVWFVILSVVFQFVGTLLAFTFYHFSVALTLGLSPFVTQGTISTIIYFVVGVALLFIAEILKSIFSK